MENKETLEEASRQYACYNFDSSFLDIDDHFEAGAKWQQEQDKSKYSEEDMQEYAEFCIRCYQKELPCIIAKDWFEQFKKQ
jgi:hypothetical protein